MWKSSSAPVPSNFSSGRWGSGAALPQRRRDSLKPLPATSIRGSGLGSRRAGRRQHRMERNASQDVDYPLSIEPAMAKVLAAVHFPRLYVLNRDERNILGWRENVGFRPSFELTITTVVALSIALTAARPTARSVPERWPAVPPWGTYCGPRPPTRARAARVAPQYAREAETPK